jgi:hypothetical protein
MTDSHTRPRIALVTGGDQGPRLGEFEAWIAAEGHTPTPISGSATWPGPEWNHDPATWRAELNRPLTRQGGLLGYPA